MGRYIVRRILWMIPVLLFISVVTFALVHAVPGGPFDREKPLPAEIQANLNKFYGLDQPIYKQYSDWMGLTRNPSGEYHGVLQQLVPRTPLAPYGERHIFPRSPVRPRPAGLAALAIALVVGVPLGVLAALKQNSIWDYFSMTVAIFGVSVPSVVLGPVFMLFFGLTLKWFPVAGWGQQWTQIIMPATALGLGSSALIARLTRASMLQVIREDYIRTARSKGLSEFTVVVRHAVKNAFIPVATILGPMFAALVTGTFVIEQIFAIPGMGRFFIRSITNRDYPVVMGTTLLYAVFLVVANLAVDITYAFLDPRIRFE